MYPSQAEQQRCRKVSIDLCRYLSRTSLAQPPRHWSALGLILTFEGARSWFDTTAIIGFSETLSLHFSQLQKPRKELNWSPHLLQVYNGPAVALQKMLRQHGRYSHSSNKENPLFVLQLFCRLLTSQFWGTIKLLDLMVSILIKIFSRFHYFATLYSDW